MRRAVMDKKTTGGFNQLKQLAEATPPKPLVEARRKLTDATERARAAEKAFEDARAIENPVRRERAQQDARADLFDARADVTSAQREAGDIARSWWTEREQALKEAVVPLVHDLACKLREAEAVNDTVRQAEQVIRLARPKEVADLPSGYQLFWKEFPYPDQPSPSRLTSWRAFVRQELGIEL